MGRFVLFLRECSSLFQICTGTETCVDFTGQNESSCWTCLALVVYAGDLLVELGEQLS